MSCRKCQVLSTQHTVRSAVQHPPLKLQKAAAKIGRCATHTTYEAANNMIKSAFAKYGPVRRYGDRVDAQHPEKNAKALRVAHPPACADPVPAAVWRHPALVLGPSWLRPGFFSGRRLRRRTARAKGTVPQNTPERPQNAQVLQKRKRTRTRRAGFRDFDGGFPRNPADSPAVPLRWQPPQLLTRQRVAIVIKFLTRVGMLLAKAQAEIDTPRVQ